VGRSEIHTPPRIARALLWLVLPEADRAAALSDIDEEFEERCLRDGRGWAVRWYRAQVRRSLWPSASRRALAWRGFGFIGEFRFSWVDVKLGVRMMRKHPALSLVSVIGMALAIAIGAGYFAAFSTLLDPALPLDEGDGIVSIQNVDIRTGSEEERILHDFIVWKDELQSVRDLAAMRNDSRNLIVEGGTTTLVRLAEMTGAGFRVAGVAPVLGRPLVDEDERPGGPPVVVIAEEVWRDLFDRDPGILGRPVRLGRTIHTVVGVMPAGFRFPLNHRFWVPLRLDPGAHERGTGPSIHVFGRLADGLTIERAEAELSAIAARLAAAFPETNGRLRTQILPYRHAFNGIDSVEVAWWVRVAQFAIGLLVVLVAVNVAILMYARTATRTGEIAIRQALGASRHRVLAQLFVEALMLSSAAAAAGLTAADIGLRITQGLLQRDTGDRLPFWVDLGLSTGTVAYVAGLAILAGVIIGVVPGLKATGRRVQAQLQHMSSRASQMALGRLWTGLILLQVALAVAILPFALYIAGTAMLRGTGGAPYPADSILTTPLSLQRDERLQPAGAGADARIAAGLYRARARELLRRLESDPAFAGVTFASRFPGDEAYAHFEVEPPATPNTSRPDGMPDPVTVVRRINEVDTDFFDVLGVHVLQGRGFRETDARDRTNPVIVDQVFADEVLGGGRVIDRRVRRIARPTVAKPGQVDAGPWLRVVGVVPDIAVKRDFDPRNDARVYRPVASPDMPVPLHLMLRVRRPGPHVASQLRGIAAEVDAGLQLGVVRTAGDVERESEQGLRSVAWAIAAITCSVLLLSAAGVHAMMSFTVARRRREIGIRAALGASPRRALGSIFARASAQLGVGVLAGLVLAAALDRLGGDALGGRVRLLLPAVAALVVGVGLLAAIGPARRGLAVPLTDALREE
jgi:predicted permease